MAHVPEELLVKIFFPQPVKTLLRLKSVCKFWNQVISSKSFIESHHKYVHQNKNISSNKYILQGIGTSYSTSLVDCESYNNVLESNKYDLHDICGRSKSSLDLGKLETYGICNGLVCLSHEKKNLYPDYPIYLWNPIVRKAKKLPPLNIEFKYIGHSYLCFGYHYDDYKVINVVPLQRVYHVYVYSLSTDSWNSLKFRRNSIVDDNRFDIWPFPRAVFVNGAAYFLQNHESKRRVVCFDLSCKIIQQIDLPEGLRDGDSSVIMAENGESIALIGRDGGDVVMWVLRMQDNSFPWDKKCTIKEEREFNFVAEGFVNKDKLVLRRSIRYSSENLGYKYFLYNIEDEFKQPFTTPEINNAGRNRRIYDLMESLVLLTETTTPCRMW